MLPERGATLTLIEDPRMPRMEEATAEFSTLNRFSDIRRGEI